MFILTCFMLHCLYYWDIHFTLLTNYFIQVSEFSYNVHFNLFYVTLPFLLGHPLLFTFYCEKLIRLACELSHACSDFFHVALPSLVGYSILYFTHYWKWIHWMCKLSYLKLLLKCLILLFISMWNTHVHCDNRLVSELFYNWSPDLFIFIYFCSLLWCWFIYGWL